MRPTRGLPMEARFIPPHPDAATMAELDSFRAFRARIFCDGGRRPSFRAADATCADAQELDFNSLHFSVRDRYDGALLGYVRLTTPAADVGAYETTRFLGAERFAAAMDAEGVAQGEVLEWARLVVDHRARGMGLGAYLNATVMAAARILGAAAIVGTSGTADGLDVFHQRFGFHVIPDTRTYVEHYTEDVCVLINRISDGASHYEDLVGNLVAEMAGALNRDDVLRVSSP